MSADRSVQDLVPTPRRSRSAFVLAVVIALIASLTGAAVAQEPTVTEVPNENDENTNPAQEWVLSTAERFVTCPLDVEADAAEEPPPRGEAFLKSYPDGVNQLVIGAGFGRPWQVQATAFRTDFAPPDRSVDVDVHATGWVDTTLEPSDALSVAEAQFAENAEVAGIGVVSTQWAVRVRRVEQVVQIFAQTDAGPGWVSVGDPLPVASLEDKFVDIKFTASGDRVSYAGKVRITVDALSFEIPVDGKLAAKIPKPDWDPSTTFSLEAGTTGDTAEQACRDREGATAVVHYDLNRSGVSLQSRVLPVTCNGWVPTVVIANGDMATSGPDVILGTTGDDIIGGGAGDDVICGGGGNDSIWGQAGNDVLIGLDGDDRLRGGAGDDILVGADGADDLAGGPGNDIVRGDGGNDLKVRGGTGNDQVFGGDGDDALVAGNGGEDTVDAGSGNDVLVTGGPRPDSVYGGAGNDVVKGNKGADQVFGDDGDDLLLGGPQPDALNGGAGTDACNGGSTGDGAPETDSAIQCEGTILNVP